MLFQLYGSTAMTQLLGWVLVFAGLVILNEIGRRTKIGGIVLFVIIPAVLTIYFIAIQAGLFGGHSNQTYEYMNGWFHYAKLYAADIGVVGFLMIKYKWGIGKKEWFKPWPFVIVAINILIAVVSDFESAIRAYQITGDFSGAWWASNEGVFLYGGWWNIVNGIAGLINIFCMTGWWGIYSSKKKDDMLWPDMTIWFIVAYDIWNFEYTYCNLPTHTWYCGVALLLAPTFANALWNKGGWIQNRAMTLATWCMFAQVFPLFQVDGIFSTLPVLYKYTGASTGMELSKLTLEQMNAAGAYPVAQGVMSILAVVANVICIAVIIKRAVEQKKNPYKNEIFADTKDFKVAIARAEK